MGTNFYHVTEAKPACECCKRPYEEDRLHIGKSSAGWTFSLHVMPELGINTLDDWVARWKTPGTFIEDEYGALLTPNEMLHRIAGRGGSSMYRWSPQELRLNGAVLGPSGLARSAVGSHCIGHGPGTYDYITGDFS